MFLYLTLDEWIFIALCVGPIFAIGALSDYSAKLSSNEDGQA